MIPEKYLEYLSLKSVLSTYTDSTDLIYDIDKIINRIADLEAEMLKQYQKSFK